MSIIVGDCRAVLAGMGAGSVQMVCTSPPYFGLRQYDGGDAEIGKEPTADAYVTALVAVFREMRRILADDGTVFLNLGDSYGPGKQLLLVPSRVALALQSDGWILRSDIIWHKPNPMPESVRDRPTSAHEHIFLLAKRSSYYYDADAIAEDQVRGDAGSTFTRGKTGINGQGRVSLLDRAVRLTRNKRNVWTITTKPFKGAHFATFPEELAETCILAGSRPGDMVFDPFAGAGTVALVSEKLGRKSIGVELNPAYAQMARERIAKWHGPLFAESEAA